MSRFVGVLSVFLVLLLAMGFAVANAGHRVTLDLGLFTLYRVPVTLVAFSGLFVGMLVMFATGIHSDLKVRRILREKLVEDARREQDWIDRNQQDLFSEDAKPDPKRDEGSADAGVGPEGRAKSDTESVKPEQPAPAVEPSIRGKTKVNEGCEFDIGNPEEEDG